MDFKGTKQDLFLKAIHMYAERGVEATSIRDITVAVGVQPSSIYNHFASKQALLDEIYRYYERAVQTLWPEQPLASEGGTHAKQLANSFPEETEELMVKILQIAVSRYRTDQQARELVNRYVIDWSKQTCRAVLDRQEGASPLSAEQCEVYEELYACLCLSCALRMYTDRPVDRGLWKQLNEALLGAVRGNSAVVGAT